MAILSDVPGLKAEILVNGQPLREFNNDDDDDAPRTPRTVTKYVEVTSDTTFEASCLFDSNFPAAEAMHSWSVCVHLDGKYMDSELLRPEELFTRPVVIDGVYTKKGRQWFIEKFCFSKLLIDDKDNGAMEQHAKKSLQELGNVSVQLHRVIILGPAVYKNSAHNLDKKLQLDIVPEKALKGRAVSHQARLQTATATRNLFSINAKWLDKKDSPYAVFTFRYRSTDALKKLHIIPRSPSPLPLEDRPLEELTLEETRELVRRQRERDADAKKVKQEIGVKQDIGHKRKAHGPDSLEADDDDFTVVDERPSKRYRTSTNEGGVETVDLT